LFLLVKNKSFKQATLNGEKDSNSGKSYQVKYDLLLNGLISFLDGYTSGTTSFNEQL